MVLMEPEVVLEVVVQELREMVEQLEVQLVDLVQQSEEEMAQMD
jgi:hypothetical protein